MTFWGTHKYSLSHCHTCGASVVQQAESKTAAKVCETKHHYTMLVKHLKKNKKKNAYAKNKIPFNKNNTESCAHRRITHSGNQAKTVRLILAPAVRNIRSTEIGAGRDGGKHFYISFRSSVANSASPLQATALWLCSSLQFDLQALDWVWTNSPVNVSLVGLIACGVSRLRFSCLN